MQEFIVLPGIGGSGERHWQSSWQRARPAMQRFAPGSWDAPQRDDWIGALNRSVGAAAMPPVLVAHSLACLLVAHFSVLSALPVAGALLVSVPDPDARAYPHAAAGTFAAVPVGPLRFPTLIVASRDDPYGSLSYQQHRAAQWGSKFVEIGEQGHINAASGLGDWPAGLALLDEFAGACQRSARSAEALPASPAAK
jgi:predicted alpha/beta hydrolase family esterase